VLDNYLTCPLARQEVKTLVSPASASVTREAASGFVTLDGMETRETIRAWCGASVAEASRSWVPCSGLIGRFRPVAVKRSQVGAF
jgi:hypothetical protein